MGRRRTRRSLSVLGVVAIAALSLAPPAAAEEDPFELVPGTAVLLAQSGDGSSGGGGNGGNQKVASSYTNIFAPATFVDYKRFGGEPTITIDRYPFLAGSVGAQRFCPAGQTSCPPRDIGYQSAPQGVVSPRYSQFWKSDDLGQSFRKSQQFPIHGLEQTNLGGGGGDSYQAVGELTHFVYFVDLTLAPGITMNVSEDLGETWRSDAFGQGLNFLDDRQWVEADEKVDRIYVSTINLLNLVTPALVSIENTTGWPTPLQLTEQCNPATYAQGVGTPAAPAPGATFCPDPADPFLWVAGPVVADNEGTTTRPPSHVAYIPFIRRIADDPLGTGIFGIDAWQLWIARSEDFGATWTRHLVAIRPPGNNPANIFPQLTIDRGGNLYYTWSETQGGPTQSSVSNRGDRSQQENFQSANEQDVFYAFSPPGGEAWSPPINLTPERGDSAVFPWMVAGDPGRVDLVYYKANTGLNSNIAFFDEETGEACEGDEEGCEPNASVWNVYFAQSVNALNTGSNFKSVQVTAQPHHLGQICTAGLGCEGDRDLLDFFTVDIDSLGAAWIAYSDDNRRRSTDTQDFMTRQIAGASVFKDVGAITLQNEWPVQDHAAIDRAGDVTNTASAPIGPCPGMDVLKTTADRRDDKITVTLTLNGAPTAAKATACGNAQPNPAPLSATGGLWGVEFWATAAGDVTVPDTTGPSNRFYIAYRDNPGDGPPRVEGGTMDHVNVTVTSLEFNSRAPGTLGGDCFPQGGPPATGTCTISMTVLASSLGITPGNALNNVTGLSTYIFGEQDDPLPGTRLVFGNSEQADAVAPFHILGSGTP